MKSPMKQLVEIKADAALLEGMLVLPENAQGLVLFVHGSGSSRHSPRNNYVAQILHERHMATLLMDLLTPQEDQDYHKRFDIDLLTRRTLSATRWARAYKPVQHLPIGYFGASTGAAAALQAAAQPGAEVAAVVSRGGRPDLAGRDDLAKVKAPTLLLVGSLDTEVIALNRQAYVYLQCTKELAIIEGATHLFEEPGTLQEVARIATSWFSQHLKA
jgi:putative phosphoribosyl transferase